MFCCKIYIFFHMSGICTMLTIWLCLRIVCHSQLYAVHIIGISPCAFTGNHLPPYTYIFYRFDPRCIFNLTWIIQVQCKMRCQYITCIITHDYSTPRRVTWSLHISFVALCIRCQPRFEYHVLIIQI